MGWVAVPLTGSWDWNLRCHGGCSHEWNFPTRHSIRLPPSCDPPASPASGPGQHRRQFSSVRVWSQGGRWGRLCHRTVLCLSPCPPLPVPLCMGPKLLCRVHWATEAEKGGGGEGWEWALDRVLKCQPDGHLCSLASPGLQGKEVWNQSQTRVGIRPSASLQALPSTCHFLTQQTCTYTCAYTRITHSTPGYLAGWRMSLGEGWCSAWPTQDLSPPCWSTRDTRRTFQSMYWALRTAHHGRRWSKMGEQAPQRMVSCNSPKLRSGKTWFSLKSTQLTRGGPKPFLFQASVVASVKQGHLQPSPGHFIWKESSC